MELKKKKIFHNKALKLQDVLQNHKKVVSQQGQPPEYLYSYSQAEEQEKSELQMAKEDDFLPS